MTRLLLFLVHNWPLKLAAVVLATLLYGMIVLTQNSRQLQVTVPIDTRNQPPAVQITSNLGDVRDIRYFAPDDVPVDSTTFQAWVDFNGVTARTGSVVFDVTVRSIDPRVSVVSWEPRQLNVQLDELVSRDGVPIDVVRDGDVPAGFEVREPELSVRSARIRGASADVARVARLEAHVQIQNNSLDIDREVDLVPVDERGERVAQIDVEPSSVRVRIAVLENGVRRTVPVRPIVTGEPAPGFEVASVAVEPDVVTIEGDGDPVAATTRVDTQPIALTGASESFARTVELALPTDVLAVGTPEVQVTVTLRPVTSTRTFSAGVIVDGARADRTYTLSTTSVLVTVGGAPPDLDRIEGRAFAVEAPVAGLDVGQHQVRLRADLAAGLNLVAITPATITVTIAQPASSSAASPPPAASP